MHARVVNLSSSCGHLPLIPGKHLREILASPDLTEERLSDLMASFVKYEFLFCVLCQMILCYARFHIFMQSC